MNSKQHVEEGLQAAELSPSVPPQEATARVGHPAHSPGSKDRAPLHLFSAGFGSVVRNCLVLFASPCFPTVTPHV